MRLGHVQLATLRRLSAGPVAWGEVPARIRRQFGCRGWIVRQTCDLADCAGWLELTALGREAAGRCG